MTAGGGDSSMIEQNPQNNSSNLSGRTNNPQSKSPGVEDGRGKSKLKTGAFTGVNINLE